MSLYYVTFGQKYAHEDHPRIPTAHPDGWLTIEAPDEETARDKAFELTDGAFAFMYDKQPDILVYPRGEVCRVSASKPEALELAPGMRVVLMTDGTVKPLEGKVSFDDVYRHIGKGCDCIDVVNLRQHGLVMLVDDMGMYQQPDINPKATALYHSICVPGTTWPIRGNVVIVPDGDFA